jgi:hypothetical protein
MSVLKKNQASVLAKNDAGKEYAKRRGKANAGKKKPGQTARGWPRDPENFE